VSVRQFRRLSDEISDLIKKRGVLTTGKTSEEFDALAEAGEKIYLRPMNVIGEELAQIESEIDHKYEVLESVASSLIETEERKTADLISREWELLGLMIDAARRMTASYKRGDA
jgi:hypothetical protein